jgi:hypothetical protein
VKYTKVMNKTRIQKKKEKEIKKRKQAGGTIPAQTQFWPQPVNSQIPNRYATPSSLTLTAQARMSVSSSSSGQSPARARCSASPPIARAQNPNLLSTPRPPLNSPQHPLSSPFASPRICRKDIAKSLAGLRHVCRLLCSISPP